MWTNVVTEEKSKPAETLAEFRGQYKYNSRVPSSRLPPSGC
jgi:phosphodiesterase/alkaline phosphatase D-like protein